MMYSATRFATARTLHLVRDVPVSSSEPVAERLRAAFATGDLAGIAPLFSADARWGDCVGGAQILDWMGQAMAKGLTATLLDAEARPDRVVLTLDLRRTHDDGAEDSPFLLHQVAFIVDGQITELRDVADRDAALHVMPSAPPPSPLGPRSAINGAAAILPVRDLRAALEHYRRLGFTVHEHEGGGYGFVERDNIEVHLGHVPALDPSTNLGAVYLYVDSADALHAEWRAAGVGGQLVEPIDTDYGLREGAHIDHDGNRVRFGSRLLD